MTKMSVGQKMRWVAGSLYLALAVYQMLCVRGVVVYASISEVSVIGLLGVVFAGVAGAMAMWMFSSRKILCRCVHRVVIVGTVLAVCYEFFTYAAQTSVIDTSMQLTFGLSGLPMMVLYLLMVLRLLLIILAAFFVTSSRDIPAPETAEEEPEVAGDQPEAEEKAPEADAGEAAEENAGAESPADDKE